MTASASAICGTNFGCTNEVASTRRAPAAIARSMSATLSAVDTGTDWFCNPSRGPTSTIWMLFGRPADAIVGPVPSPEDPLPAQPRGEPRGRRPADQLRLVGYRHAASYWV